MGRHIVSFSTGVPSAATAILICTAIPDAIVVFADVLWEDEDNYRFLQDVQDIIGKEIITLSGNRSPLEIADQEGYAYIPNQLTATCTRKGKIQVIKEFMRPFDTLYIGMTNSEHSNRDLKAPIRNWAKAGVLVRYPLIQNNINPHEFIKQYKLNPPRMYAMEYSHANCGGRCVKQGRGDWLKTLENFPERYLEVEQWEKSQREKQAIRILIEMALYASIHPIYLMFVKLSRMYTLVRRQVKGVQVGISLEELRQEYSEKNNIKFHQMIDELEGSNCLIECGVGDNKELELVFGA